MAGAGSVQRFARRPPFPFPWVVAGDLGGLLLPHQSQVINHSKSARAPSFRRIARWCLVSAAPAGAGAGADADAPGHFLDVPTVLVQGQVMWQDYSPTFTPSSFLC